jgi:hypothetical protein
MAFEVVPLPINIEKPSVLKLDLANITKVRVSRARVPTMLAGYALNTPTMSNEAQDRSGVNNSRGWRFYDEHAGFV